MNLHGLVIANGALDASDGAVHIAQQEGVVQVIEGGSKETPGRTGGRKSSARKGFERRRAECPKPPRAR